MLGAGRFGNVVVANSKRVGGTKASATAVPAALKRIGGGKADVLRILAARGGAGFPRCICPFPRRASIDVRSSPSVEGQPVPRRCTSV